MIRAAITLLGASAVIVAAEADAAARGVLVAAAVMAGTIRGLVSLGEWLRTGGDR